ncbi:hypothetical protein, partial [Klebsiella pneumoniae]|uniref:hypothetical protein n=1 Tax=Klebsiella pneumoniae TaxID=573 RepID=UPI00301399B7
MGSCAAPSAKGDDKFITTDYLQQCHLYSSFLSFPFYFTFTFLFSRQKDAKNPHRNDALFGADSV